MTKFKTDRRSGVERREFHYTICIPERRSGIDRRCGENGKEILLPQQNAGVGAIILPVKEGDVSGQPYMVAFYQNKQYIVNLRYLYINEQFIDFHSGIEATG